MGRRVEKLVDHLGDFSREHWRDRIAHLAVLLRPIAFKEIVVGEGLQPRRLSHGQATALRRIVMDVVVPVLLDVGNSKMLSERLWSSLLEHDVREMLNLGLAY